MGVELRLADIGEGLTEAEIVRWLVAVGDRVREDQPVVEIQTDKAVTEMPSPATGTVAALGAAEGDVIRVGDLLVVIDAGDGAPAAPAAPAPAAAAAARPKATPATRARARALGVDLATVTGTGPGGRITDADLDHPVSAPAAAHTASDRPDRVVGGEDERVPFRGVRRRTAENLTASWQQVPHVSSFAEVDVTDLFALRDDLKPEAAERGVALTLAAFFVKATALALRRHPMMNARLDVDASEIVMRSRRNVAVAVDTPDGLVLPVVVDADALPLLTIARRLDDLIARARDRTLDLASMSGSTFTISNYGPLGGWFGTSLVRPGETGVLGFGPAPEKPAVVDGQIVVRRIMVLNAGADHRVVDGQDIIAFIVAVKELLEHPVRLLAEG
jgi:pyruvate/2-oxoglutarate dehydrogenase complex dihydrolipoamide acyltransferase (E2) component